MKKQCFHSIWMDVLWNGVLVVFAILCCEWSPQPIEKMIIELYFDCGDEVLVESTPPVSPDMAARLAAPSQGTGGAAASPNTVRELIVIPELPNSIHLQHAIQQVSSDGTVVEVNGADSSGHSSPTAEAQHTYITVATEAWYDTDCKAEVKVEIKSEPESAEGGNYHVQYVEPQEIYTQGHQTHMEQLRTYPVCHTFTTVTNTSPPTEVASDGTDWNNSGGQYTAYGVVVTADEAEAPSSPATPPVQNSQPRMPPATVQWLLDHYETAEGVSLPRSTLYAHYLRHCATHRLDPVNAASFGKLIRSVFVGLRTRRLGTRGNSKYHYYGIRAKTNAAESPPTETREDTTEIVDTQEIRDREQPEPSPVGAVGVAHSQYFGTVTPPTPPPLTMDQLPEDVPPIALHLLHQHHRDHGVEFLGAVAALDTGAVERARRAFWRRPPPELCRRALCKLAAKKEVAEWLMKAELQLYQKAVELLLPDVLRPIPPQLTQAIRNFAKSLESALAAGAGGPGGAPPLAARAQASTAAALAAALRRYTSLNHLAQAARAVLTNHHQIHQMLADLNRVDFRVVREQAAWACACGAADTVSRLEADFKATLGRGATLEQWASWLENCVGTALAPHEKKADYTQRAKRLLLDWSFYSSLVIRELTLRSAASFGSFHLIRLLYDEYVSYLIERRVATHSNVPPIAVMHQNNENLEELPESKYDDDDPDWEWGDEEDEDDEPEVKKIKLAE